MYIVDYSLKRHTFINRCISIYFIFVTLALGITLWVDSGIIYELMRIPVSITFYLLIFLHIIIFPSFLIYHIYVIAQIFKTLHSYRTKKTVLQSLELFAYIAVIHAFFIFAIFTVILDFQMVLGQ